MLVSDRLRGGGAIVTPQLLAAGALGADTGVVRRLAQLGYGPSRGEDLAAAVAQLAAALRAHADGCGGGGGGGAAKDRSMMDALKKVG